MPDMPFLEAPVVVRRLVMGDGDGWEGDARRAIALTETEPASDLVRAAIDHWHAMRGNMAVPLRRALDPLDIPTLLANSELIEILGPPLDFRYRLIGDVIDRISRDRYVGKCLSEIPSQRPPSAIFTLYAETVRRELPVCAVLPYVGDDRFIDHVEVVTMPLIGSGSTVDRLWGVVVPAERESDAR